MTIPSSDIEKDEKIATVAAVIAEDPEQGGGEQKTVATAVCTTGSCALSGTRDATIISVEPSIYKLATVGEAEDLTKRQANLCCGSCCDVSTSIRERFRFRSWYGRLSKRDGAFILFLKYSTHVSSLCAQLLRACIVVNIVFIVLNALGVVLSFWGISFLDSIDVTQLEDDDVVDGIEQMMDRTSLIYMIVIIQQGLGIIFGILGIVGASKYMKFLVLTAGVWYCIDLIICAAFINIPAVVMRGFFAYPHIACFVALKKGQITRETYNRERYCCCDSSPP